jgi:transcriptional regulator of arginine metabolism
MNKNTDSRRARQALLKELIGRADAADQGLLLREMRKRGVRTTQATISRDLQEMGLVKVRTGPGTYRYEAFDPAAGGGPRARLQVLFRNFVVGIKGTGQILLVKTSPGNANGVASLIDALRKKEILGTVAGDDTILVVTAGAKDRKDVQREFESLL